MERPIDWERRLLAGCDADQVAAITSPAAPLLVVAAAGSGKTRVLTRRIAWRVHTGSATPGHVLALTFTRKAAAELRGRLAQLGLPAPVTAGTFHALALAELRRRFAETGRHAPVVLESKARLLAAALGEGSGRGRPAPTTPDRRELLSGLASEIEWAKARLVGPERYAAAARAAERRPPLGPEQIAEVYARYERERKRRRAYDFDDLLAALAVEIETDGEFAAAQRWRFAHLFVDELQDANPAQLRLLEAWRGGRPDLFAVGDPRQAIYGWNGADPSGVLRFRERFPGAGVLSLDTNYRSSPEVVTLAATVLDKRARPGEIGSGAIRSAREGGMPPSVCAYADELAEASGIAAALRRAHRPGRPWTHCAVLARTNAQLVVLEQVLRAAGVPVRSSAGGAFLARAHVRGVLAELDPGAGTVALRSFLERLTALAEDEGEDAEAARDDARPPTGEEERADFAALARLGVEYVGVDPQGSAEGFLAFVRSALRADPPLDERDAVELVTFHRAKGLEWPVVFVAGLEDGFVPIAHALAADAREEERRLLYVALSRAEDEVHCSWARTRRFGTRSVERSPSPYLAEIEAACRRIAESQAPATRHAREHLAATRAALRDATERRSR